MVELNLNNTFVATTRLTNHIALLARLLSTPVDESPTTSERTTWGWSSWYDIAPQHIQLLRDLSTKRYNTLDDGGDNCMSARDLATPPGTVDTFALRRDVKQSIWMFDRFSTAMEDIEQRSLSWFTAQAQGQSHSH